MENLLQNAIPHHHTWKFNNRTCLCSAMVCWIGAVIWRSMCQIGALLLMVILQAFIALLLVNCYFYIFPQCVNCHCQISRFVICLYHTHVDFVAVLHLKAHAVINPNRLFIFCVCWMALLYSCIIKYVIECMSSFALLKCIWNE